MAEWVNTKNPAKSKVSTGSHYYIRTLQPVFPKMFWTAAWRKTWDGCFWHYPSKHLSWWRRLEDVFRLRLQKTSWRRLDQDEYVRLSLTSPEDIFKKSSRRLGQDQYIRLGYTPSRRLQDVLQNVFMTSSRRLQDVLKTSSRRLVKISSRRFQDVSSS